ncbi:hypothetical protein ACFWAT_20245 [Streptomyces syringium]|uniref:hypothetical protein n=1 Tax=Streptomyces syringium TaxID=76729 RepID=UPI00364A3392
MKLSPNTAPVEPTALLIRMHNQVGAAIDVAGTKDSCRWRCHGCGYRTDMCHRVTDGRRSANDHAGACRAAYHRLG